MFQRASPAASARRLSIKEGNREHRWDVLEDVPSGWAHVPTSSMMDRTIHFFYERWQQMGSRRPGRRRGEEERFWGVDRPGLQGDYLDDSVARREDRDD